eukprot:3038159-Amphidinium_carterae.1
MRQGLAHAQREQVFPGGASSLHPAHGSTHDPTRKTYSLALGFVTGGNAEIITCTSLDFSLEDAPLKTG